MKNIRLTVIFGVILISLFVVLALLWQQNIDKETISINPPQPQKVVSTPVPTALSPIPNTVDNSKSSLGTLSVKVFFGSDQSPQGDECTSVYPAIRETPKTQAVARAALEELLEGPTQSEKNQGYYTSINTGVRVQKLEIVEGTARVDFTSRIEEGIGGSCRVTSIRSQIRQTLLQFPTIDEVIISVDGRTEDALQP